MKDRQPAVHIDPVCKMQVTEGQEAARREYDGITYHFCNKVCARRFMQDPELYLRTEKPEVRGQNAEVRIAEPNERSIVHP
jgi:YHS domain-containing protein